MEQMGTNRTQPHLGSHLSAYMPQPVMLQQARPYPPYPSQPDLAPALGYGYYQSYSVWPSRPDGHQLLNTPTPVQPPTSTYASGHPSYGPLTPQLPVPSFQGPKPPQDQGNGVLEISPVYVHTSWAAVIPPNGVPGHPSLIDESASNLLSKPQSSTITLRRPDGQRIVIQNGSNSRNGSLMQTDKGSNGVSGNGTSGEYKASLSPSGLSKFATVYEPLWIRSLRPPTSIKRLPPAAPHVPPGYPRAFLPDPIATSSRFLNRWETRSILSDAPPEVQDLKRDPVVAEDPTAYMKHFTELLALELSSLQQKALSYKLNHAQLALEKPRAKVVGQFTSTTLGVWTLQVPGIREDAPRIFLGDVVVLRKIDLRQQRAEPFMFEARVIGSLKRDGKVYIDSDTLWAADSSVVTGTYQVEFKVNSQQICLMQNAVAMLSGLIHERQELWFDRLLSSQVQSEQSSAMAYLFPTEQNIRNAEIATVEKAQSEDNVELDWIDPNLNKEQKKAISDIVSGRHDVPYLLFGPAGTGKTKTCVESVLQVVRTQPKASLLVCAPSNSAADTIALRLAKFLKGTEMLRLQNPTRTIAEVPGVLRDAYCNLQNGQFTLPEWKEVMKYRVVVTTCTDAGMLAVARLTNADLMWAQSELGQTNPRSIPRLTPHWTHLIIDEAGQAMEPETLIPLSVVTPGEEESALAELARPVIVLCGDIKQLPAIVSCDQAREGGLDVSLLERLMERPLYQETEKHITCLAINYRSHSGILWLPNTLFYNDRLKPCNAVPLSKWSGLPNPKLPILVKHIDGEDDWVEEGASWFNQTEVRECRDIVLSLLAEYRQSEIGVVTPWREQVLHLRKEFRESGLWDVNIGNVEAYQGAEYKAVIISCVRSRSEFVPSDRAKGMGFIDEPKRFNVAITRAKEVLVVVGNCNVHAEDPSFRELLRSALRNNLYVGTEDLTLAAEDEQLNGVMSNLEIKTFAESNSSDVSRPDGVEKHGMFVTNGMVQSLYE